MTNNHSERALRGIAVGRRAWLFFGSDDHASAAANLFSLIASAELHGLDPETYLSEIIHVAALLAARPVPRAGSQVLGRHPRTHSAHQLDVEIGDITVPPPPPPQEQLPTS